MPRLPLLFLAAASLCLIGGVTLGMYMGVAHDFTLAPVHAHLNLLGWASLALFGLAYRAFPELAVSRLAVWHFALAVPSGVLFPFAIYLSMVHDSSVLTRFAAPAWWIGAILFAINVCRQAFAYPAAARHVPVRPGLVG
jgi:hypothetical protein